MTSVPLDGSQIIDEKEADHGLSDQDNDKSVSSSASDSSDECPFSTDICAKLTAAFAKATGIDREFAVQLLKDHGWNVDQALKATYEAKEHAQSILHAKQDWKKSGEKYFKILSWNADAADSDDEASNDLIEQRTETMVEILLREKPDVILLQEVGTLALTLIITCLSALYDDESVQIDSPSNCNYVSIFTRKSTMKKTQPTIISNDDGWKMLKVEAEYKNCLKLALFNAVIDDQTSPFCFEQINNGHADRHGLFGISNKISSSADNFDLSNLVDVWQMTGEPAETTFTYDPELNSNISDREQPQRCDRLFVRSLASSTLTFHPVHLEFEGVQHIRNSDMIFPSTHWAIQGYFGVDS